MAFVLNLSCTSNVVVCCNRKSVSAYGLMTRHIRGVALKIKRNALNIAYTLSSKVINYGMRKVTDIFKCKVITKIKTTNPFVLN